MEKISVARKPSYQLTLAVHTHVCVPDTAASLHVPSLLWRAHKTCVAASFMKKVT